MAKYDVKLGHGHFDEVMSGDEYAAFKTDISNRYEIGDTVRLIEINTCNPWCGESMPCSHFYETGREITLIITDVIIINDIDGEFNRLEGSPYFSLISFDIMNVRNS